MTVEFVIVLNVSLTGTMAEVQFGVNTFAHFINFQYVEANVNFGDKYPQCRHE